MKTKHWFVALLRPLQGNQTNFEQRNFEQRNVVVRLFDLPPCVHIEELKTFWLLDMDTFFTIVVYFIYFYNFYVHQNVSI